MICKDMVDGYTTYDMTEQLMTDIALFTMKAK